MEEEEEGEVLEVEGALEEEVLLIAALSMIAEVEWEEGLERLVTADQSLRVGAAMGADTQQTATEWVQWDLVEGAVEAVQGTTVDTPTITTAMATAVGCLATVWEVMGVE